MTRQPKTRPLDRRLREHYGVLSAREIELMRLARTDGYAEGYRAGRVPRRTVKCA